VVAVLGAAFSLSGCTSSQMSDVSAAAQQFYTSVAERDGGEACELLSAETRTELEQASGETCADAILGEDLQGPDGVDSARVYGTMAIVTADDDTMFLGRFPDGWLITGVGCRPTHQADRYDCSVAGG
jgi:hypothetical protein